MSIPKHSIVTDKLWVNDAAILFRKDRATEFFPNIMQTEEERLNSLARLSIYGGIILALYKRDYRQLLWGALGMLTTYLIYASNNTMEMMESEPVPKPTLNNPFMNPSFVSGITKAVPNYSADTAEASELKAQVKKNFDYNLFKGIDDVYDKNNSQRQFYTVPNTETPSNQQSFIDFLYPGMKKNCKSDTSVCQPYSDLRANPFIFPDPKSNPLKNSS